MKKHWYALPKEEVIRLLHGNAVTGLSHKTARSLYRQRRTGKDTDFYYVPKKSVLSVCVFFLSDFSFWMLFLSSLVFACFENMREAGFGLIFLVLNFLLSVLAEVFSCRTREMIALNFQPKIRVIREGKLLLTDCRCVVPGDLVLFSAGDVIPFDARLLSSEHLSVSVYTGEKGSYLRTEKDSEAILPLLDGISPAKQINMLTAGSVILSGSGRAIVVEVGTYTYTGAYAGGISLGTEEKENKLIPAVKEVQRTVSLSIFAAAIPVCLLFSLSGKTEAMPTAFFVMVALSGILSSGWISALLDFSAMWTIRKAAERREHAVLIRSGTVAERVANTDLFAVFGKNALTDGIPLVYGVSVGGSVFTKEKKYSSECRSLAERMLLLLHGRSGTLSEGVPGFDKYRDTILAYAGKTGAEREKLGIRCQIKRYFPFSGKSGLEAVEYVEQGKKHLLLSSDNIRLLSDCRRIDCYGVPLLLSGARRKTAEKQYWDFIRAGCEIRIYAEQTEDDELVLIGMVAYREAVAISIRETVSTLSSAGTRPILFLSGESPADFYYAGASGFLTSSSGAAVASVFRREGKKMTDEYGSYSAYLGFSEEECLSFLRQMSANGIRVTGVGGTAETAAFLHETDLSVVSDRFRLKNRTIDREILDRMPTDGFRDGDYFSQELKMNADLLLKPVRRANGELKAEGGVEDLAGVLRLSRLIQANQKRFLSYLLFSLSLRIGWILPTFWGALSVLDAVRILFSGLLLDFGVGIVSAFGKKEGDTMVGAQVGFVSKKSFFSENRALVLSGLLSGLMISLIPLFFSLIGHPFSTSCDGTFRYVGLLSLSLLGFFRLSQKSTGKAVDLPTAVLAGVVFSLTAFSLLFPPLGRCFGFGFFHPAILFFLPVYLTPLLLWKRRKKKTPDSIRRSPR